MFNRSYEGLMQDKLVDAIREWGGSVPAMENAEAVPPYSHGSHRSKACRGAQEGALRREALARGVDQVGHLDRLRGSLLRFVLRAAESALPGASPISGLCLRSIPLAGFLLRRHDSPCPPRFPRGLLAWWPLDGEQDASADDESGQGHKAQLVGTTRCKGHDGRDARQFDGRGYLESRGLGMHEARVDFPVGKASVARPAVEPAVVRPRHRAGHRSFQSAGKRHAQRGGEQRRAELDALQGQRVRSTWKSGITWFWFATRGSGETFSSISMASRPVASASGWASR